MKMNIPVNQPFLPPIDNYKTYIEKIWNNSYLTNQGPLLKEFESTIKKFLEVDNFQFVANGTVALELALEALDCEDAEIITTPFSFVATTSSILWRHCKPVFVDIEPDNFTIDVKKIEEAITSKTRAILPVHVFGYACDIENIEKIAKKHSLFVIYDAAHAFGVNYKGKSILSYGDISCVSFHTTKLFHTIEGGGCICSSKEISEKIDLIKRFGYDGDEHKCLGINAKVSEFNAAMGLANFPFISEIISKRKQLSQRYDELLLNYVKRPKTQEYVDYNYGYFPVLFKNNLELLKVFDNLKKHGIYARRYFFPSLNTLKYLPSKQSCEVSEDICSRIACLPLYYSLTLNDVENVSKVIIETLKN